MGGLQSSGVLKKSPLGCILTHWKDLEDEEGEDPWEIQGDWEM